MKVLHLSSEKTWRGGEQQIAYLIEELTKKKVTSFVALRENSSFEKYCLVHKIPHQSFSFSSEFDLKTSWGIKKYARDCGVELIHIHSAKSHGLAVLSAVLGLKTPLILSKRTDFPIRKNLFSQFKFRHESIKKILCVSGKIKEIVDHTLKNESLSEVVYSGVDLKKFSFHQACFLHDLLNLPHDIKLVGNTSAIADQKDYFTFVDVAKEVARKRKDVRFVIIGTGPMESQIKAYVKNQKLENVVLFTGFLANLPDILFNLDVFLITSKTEGLGTSILDAFACGVPVVATRAGGIGEIVIDKRTGSLCPIKDVRSLSQKVLERLEDKDTFESQEFVLQFSKEATCEKTYQVYLNVMSSLSC